MNERLDYNFIIFLSISIKMEEGSLSLCIVKGCKRNYLTVQSTLNNNNFFPKICMFEALYHQSSPITIRDYRFDDNDNMQNGFNLEKQGQEVQVFWQRGGEQVKQTKHIESVDNNKRKVINIPYIQKQRVKKIKKLLDMQPTLGNIQLFQKIFKQVDKIGKEIIVIFNLFKGEPQNGQISYHLKYMQCQQFNKRLQQKQIQQKQIKQIIKVFQAVLARNNPSIKQSFNKYTQKVIDIIDTPELRSLDGLQITIGAYLFLFKYLHVTSKDQLKDYVSYVSSRELKNKFFELLLSVIQGNSHKPAYIDFVQKYLYQILTQIHQDYKKTVKKYVHLLQLENKIAPSHIAKNRKFVDQIFSIKNHLPFHFYGIFFSKIFIPWQKYSVQYFFCDKKFTYESIRILEKLLKIQQKFIRDNLDYKTIDQLCSKYILKIQEMILDFQVTKTRGTNFSRIPELYGLFVYLKDNKRLALKMKQTIIVLEKKLEELHLFVIKLENRLPASQALEFSAFMHAFEKSNSTNDPQDQFRRHIHENQPHDFDMTHE